jgi:chemotaxis protein MotB
MRIIVYVALLAPLLGGCLVPKKRYDALQAELDSTKTSLNAQIADRDKKITDLEAAIADEKAKLADLDAQRAKLAADLDAEQAHSKSLLDEKAELLAGRAAAEQRIADYQNLLSKFKKLIDAGTLTVKIVDGRMVVALATDILFSSGSADLSPQGMGAISEVSGVLASIQGRKYQVEGHTDNVPIKTDKYPSNWELASARALTVVKTMIGAGMPPDRVSAASFGEYKPVAANDTAAGKAQNRRIEIVIVPDLSDLPGFDELKKVAGQ